MNRPLRKSHHKTVCTLSNRSIKEICPAEHGFILTGFTSSSETVTSAKDCKPDYTTNIF
jgi:hypothetical protein